MSGRPSQDDPERILIVRIGAMGDVLHALPAVAALRQARPEIAIHWAIEPRWAPLLSSAPEDAAGRGLHMPVVMPIVDGWLAADARAWKRAPFSRATGVSVQRLRQRMRERQFSLAVDMQGTIRSAAIGRMAGARRLVGGATPREAPARWIYGERVPVRTRHVVEGGCELLGAATGVSLAPAPVVLPVDKPAEAWAAEFFGGGRGPLVLLAPTAGWGAKEWPAERFGQLAARLAAEGCRVLVNAAAASDPVGLQVVAASGGAARLVPASLAELIALTRRAALTIAGDTGPLHLAAALGIPVVGIYGPTDPRRTGPYGTRARVLRNAASLTDHRRHASTEAGLARMTVDEVLRAARDLLAEAAL